MKVKIQKSTIKFLLEIKITIKSQQFIKLLTAYLIINKNFHFMLFIILFKRFLCIKFYEN